VYPRLITSRPAMHQLAASGRLVAGLAMSLAPRFCIASPSFEFLPPTDEYSAETASSLHARDGDSCDPERGARARARQGRRHPLTIPAAGMPACAVGGRR
jgi:hypothetical protein